MIAGGPESTEGVCPPFRHCDGQFVEYWESGIGDGTNAEKKMRAKSFRKTDKDVFIH